MSELITKAEAEEMGLKAITGAYVMHRDPSLNEMDMLKSAYALKPDATLVRGEKDGEMTITLYSPTMAKGWTTGASDKGSRWTVAHRPGRAMRAPRKAWVAVDTSKKARAKAETQIRREEGAQ